MISPLATAFRARLGSSKPGADGAKPGADGAKPGADGAKPGADGAKPGADGAKPGADSALESQLARLFERGRARWPDVVLDGVAYVEHLADVLAGAADPEAALAGLHAEDLYLACACALGHERAVAAFDREILAHVGEYVREIRDVAAELDEMRQRLREKLLVASGGRRPKIADYAGTGALGAWVRVAALRTALNWTREADNKRRTRSVDVAEAVVAGGPGPELEVLKARYSGAFEAALAGALATLEPKQRTLLRLSFIDGMSIDQIAVAYRVHRATAARWLVSARHDVLERTMRQLGEDLPASRSELASLAAIVRSQLRVSVARLLADSP